MRSTFISSNFVFIFTATVCVSLLSCFGDFVASESGVQNDKFAEESYCLN